MMGLNVRANYHLYDVTSIIEILSTSFPFTFLFPSMTDAIFRRKKVCVDYSAIFFMLS